LDNTARTAEELEMTERRLAVTESSMAEQPAATGYEEILHYYARTVNTKANAMSLSPSEVIQYAIKSQLKESV
jgi:hypothetical protein